MSWDYKKFNIESLLVSTIIFIACYIATGYYFELYEPTKASIIAGAFGSPPTELWLTNWNYLLVPLWSLLSFYFPSLPIYGIWNFAVLYLCILLLYQLTQRIFPHKFSFRISLFISLLILMYSQFININNTRESIMLGFLCIINYMFLPPEKKVSRLLLIFCFTVSCLIRIETSLVVVAILGLYILLEKRQVSKAIKLMLPFFAISFFVTASFHFNYKYQKNYGKIIEHEYSHFYMNKVNVKGIEAFKQPYDSIRYVSYMNGLYCDVNHITIPFLDSIVNNKSYFDKVLSTENLMTACNNTKDTIIHISNYFIIVLASIIVIFLFNKRSAFNFLIMLSFTFLIFYVIDVWINLEERMYIPIIGIVAAIVIISLYRTKEALLLKKPFLLLAIPVLFAFIFFPKILNAKQEYLNYIEEYKKINNELDGYIRKGYTILFFDSGEEVVSVDPMENRTKITLLPIHLWYYSFHEFASKKTSQEFGYSLTDYESIYSFLQSNRKIIILSTYQKMKLLKDYYKIVYGKELNFAFSNLLNENNPHRFMILKNNEFK